MKRLAFKAAPLLAALALAGCASISPDGLRGDVARHTEGRLPAGAQLPSPDAQALQDAVTGHDVVLSAAHFSTLPASAIIEPVKKAGVKRLLFVGGAGSLLLPGDTKVIDSPGFPDEYRPEATAGGVYLDTLRAEKDLDWSFLSPSAEFVEGERTGKFRLGTDRLLINSEGKSWISFADFAIAMLDEVEQPKHSRQRFTVGY